MCCVVHDKRGHGDSDWSGHGSDSLAGDLAALLDHLDVIEATAS
ncbi:hypothetical protein P8A22_37220 [Streptomyces laculatispora]|uniref:Uncharacterized protein n=1 Tax=Streptomyces laculatispora TaxID=887464 RepID=A0ABY9IDS0_9ACTN|nr:hypothetical protein [Streptomyces laculatispora]WLQ45037.1 hypothetical protein P8A22_37220 [Streptomyces laculatispora]